MICSDQGTNFIAKLTRAIEELFGVSPRFSTPGHAKTMGAVERWNRTLKEMLNLNIQEHGRHWDLHLPYLLLPTEKYHIAQLAYHPFRWYMEDYHQDHCPC